MSKLLPINERITAKGTIIEHNSAKLPKGVLCRVAYPVCNVGKLNANNRVYEKEVWEKVIGDSNIQEKMKSRTLFGHAEHPESTQSSVEKVSHIITKTWLDETTNTLHQEMDVLDTPYGRIVDTLLLAECALGVSTRAEGELQEAEVEGKKCQKVIPESYRYVTTDFTADPSTYGTAPEKIERDLVGQIKNGVESKKIDREFATHMLESMKINEAKTLLESMKKSDLLEKKAVTKGKVKKAFEDKYPQSPQIVDFLVEHWEEFIDENDAVSQVVKSYEISNELAKQYVEAVTSEMGAIQPVTAFESKLVFESWEDMSKYIEAKLKGMPTGVQAKLSRIVMGGTQSDMTRKFLMEAEIKAAEDRADRDVAMERIAEKDVELANLRESVVNKDVRINELTKRYSADVIKYSKVIESKTKELNEVLSKVTITESTLNEARAETKQAVAKREKDIVDMYEKKLATEKQMFEKQTLEGKTQYENLLTQEKGKAAKLMVTKYSKRCVEDLGYKIPQETQALLEQCASLEEVDRFMGKVKDALRENLLHPGKLDTVEIESKANPEVGAIFEKVASAMNGMLKK